MSAVLEVLRERSPLFVTQVAARTRLPIADVERQIECTGAERVLVIEHPSPDPHVTADLRIAALVRDSDVDGALHEADRLWREWLQHLLQAHRCA